MVFYDGVIKMTPNVTNFLCSEENRHIFTIISHIKNIRNIEYLRNQFSTWWTETDEFYLW